VFGLADDMGYGDPGFYNPDSRIPTPHMDRLSIAGDTLVIMASDNSPHPGIEGHMSVGPLRGYKTHIWEGGHRIPFIARWPGRIKAGSVSDEPICLTDLMATLSAITGAVVTPEAGPDSYDISPALFGESLKRPIREALVHQSANGTFAIRQGEWKLILDNKTSGGWMPPSGKPPEPGTPGQLYNLARDPYEQDDLWDRHPEIVERLSALLERYKKEGRSAPLRD
jgi:arylsulfatase A-like enzyme